ncbi:MAG: HU family DNA-binding protein [Spirochaetales bacterium]|uniref:HU family DNA-binding protein n=1 Tax=Candidatus Thalassospirochaeta sargassi TaxID=3119039 RepID=A0AAJ1MIM8_9SPIO|nr:HU family DNA-binding protein [Spirochaetales bacterium]
MDGNMIFEDLPEAIGRHLQGLAAEQEKLEDQDYLASLADVWRQKEALFREQAKSVKLEIVDSVSNKDGRGMMILSYSGSILCVGPVFMTSTNINFSRWTEYSSIKLRTEVPDIIMEKAATLEAPVEVDKSVLLGNSRVKATSPAYLIAVCPEDLNEDEQDKRIRESAVFITAGFMKYNQTLQLDTKSVPDQFTMKSMVRFIAKKHGLTGQEAKLVIDDFITLIETGMLMGDSVPFGRLGKFSIKTRDAQKARVVKHPQTGEEMTVGAKPARGVPKISFSSYLKERAEGVVSDE